MPVAERTFRAMGTDCHVVVVTDSLPDQLLTLARDRVELLEDCWSRFRPTSELNRLNAAAGIGPIAVSDDLFTLVEHMRSAWETSGGLFDPTVLASMTSLGYDADFDAVLARSALAVLDDVAVQAAPGMAGVELDEAARTVLLPRRVGVDPGAIGKGLAADIIVAELMSAGAGGVLVNLGGDLSFAGQTEDGSPWSIGVEDERLPAGDPGRLLRVLEFPADTLNAGIATSTTLKRRWAQGRRHHVIDPRTGTMSASDLVQVTVVADHAWEAEVTATTALLMSADEATGWLRECGVTALLMTTERLIETDEEDSDG